MTVYDIKAFSEKKYVSGFALGYPWKQKHNILITSSHSYKHRIGIDNIVVELRKFNKYLPVSSKLSLWGAAVVHPKKKWVKSRTMMTSSNGDIFRVIAGPLCGEFTGLRWTPHKRPVTRSFYIFFKLHQKKCLSKQLIRAHYDVIVIRDTLTGTVLLQWYETDANRGYSWVSWWEFIPEGVT